MMSREVGLALRRQEPRVMRPNITTRVNQIEPRSRMALENRNASGRSPYPAININEPTAIPRITLRGIHGLSYPPNSQSVNIQKVEYAESALIVKDSSYVIPEKFEYAQSIKKIPIWRVTPSSKGQAIFDTTLLTMENPALA